MDDCFVVDVDSMKPFTRGDGPIVVVDDDDALIFLVKSCYKKTSKTNELLCMRSGQELLRYFDEIESNNATMPDIILLDINMPGKNGFTVLEEIRSIKRFERIPVIVMFTASDSMADMERAKDLKANGFFSKPSKIKDFIKFFEQI